MEATLLRPQPAHFWVLRRLEHVAQLTPADGVRFGLSFAEARRLLSYAGFSLYLDARSVELGGVCGLLAGRMASGRRR